MKKRILSLVLTLCLLAELLPAPSLAAEAVDAVTGIHCVHVRDETCGYMEAAPEQPCGHVHDADCGYTAPSEGTPCAHVHDESCGWAPAVEGSPCTHVCTVESRCLDIQPGTDPSQQAPGPEPGTSLEEDPEEETPEPAVNESLQLMVQEADAALEGAEYSVVLMVPGEWDAYDWQLWAGAADGWTSLGVEAPALPVFKEMFVSFAFRYVVEKDGVKTASAPYPA